MSLLQAYFEFLADCDRVQPAKGVQRISEQHRALIGAAHSPLNLHSLAHYYPKQISKIILQKMSLSQIQD